jgi:hypothetical protein
LKKNRFTPSENKPPGKTDTVPPHPDKNGHKFLFRKKTVLHPQKTNLLKKQILSLLLQTKTATNSYFEKKTFFTLKKQTSGKNRYCISSLRQKRL